jgi:hypothetical protein
MDGGYENPNNKALEGKVNISPVKEIDKREVIL